MTEETALTYLQQGQRGIFAEVYFPRRVAAQGTIFKALERGFHEDEVKEYLARCSKLLLAELPRHLQIFDPQWYEVLPAQRQELTKQDVEARIEKYVSPFFGWSNYAVDGVFWSKKKNDMVEESTQIVRLMFCFESSYAKEAKEAQCYDALRAMMFWMISRQARLTDTPRWHQAELKKFLREYGPFKPKKRRFAQKYFEPLAREIFKWMGDWFLFIFGYLVRQFAEELTGRDKAEEEIWVTTFWNLTVSVMTAAPQQQSS